MPLLEMRRDERILTRLGVSVKSRNNEFIVALAEMAQSMCLF